MNRVPGALLLLTALVPLVLGSPALAQEPGTDAVDFVVSPASIAVRVAPGDTQEIPMRVTNRSAKPLELLTYVQAIEIAPTDLVTTDELAFTAARWTRFTEPVLVVPGNSQATAVLFVDVPRDAPTGGYHAFAFFQSQVTAGDGVVLQSGRIGSTVLLDVAQPGAEIVRSARVSETTLEVHWDGLFAPRVEAATTVVNTGETHVVTGGLHTYRTFPGSETGDVELDPRNVLRGTQHTFVSSFTSVPVFGRVTVTSEIVYQVGPGELPVILTQESVWVIPWRLLGILLVLVLAGGFLLWRLRRHRSPQTKPQPRAEEKSWLELEPPELVP